MLVEEQGGKDDSDRVVLAEERDGDSVVESGDLKILVDPNSASHLTGSKVDFIEDHRGSGFTVDNPNAPAPASDCSSGGCSGCG